VNKRKGRDLTGGTDATTPGAVVFKRVHGGGEKKKSPVRRGGDRKQRDRRLNTLAMKKPGKKGNLGKPIDTSELCVEKGKAERTKGRALGHPEATETVEKGKDQKRKPVRKKRGGTRRKAVKKNGKQRGKGRGQLPPMGR